MLGYQEIIIILVIALLVFGPQKLPEIGRQVGSALRELRKMSSDMQRALDLDDHGNSSSNYDRYDYDRDRGYNDRYSSADRYDSDSSFAYSAPEGQTYAQGQLTGTEDGSAALPAPPGPPTVVGRDDYDPSAYAASYEASSAGESRYEYATAQNGAVPAAASTISDTPASGGNGDAPGERVAASSAPGGTHKES